jgi:hypothetical protein
MRYGGPGRPEHRYQLVGAQLALDGNRRALVGSSDQ